MVLFVRWWLHRLQGQFQKRLKKGSCRAMIQSRMCVRGQQMCRQLLVEAGEAVTEHGRQGLDDGDRLTPRRVVLAQEMPRDNLRTQHLDELGHYNSLRVRLCVYVCVSVCVCVCM
jgi:hypothetical protein